MKPEFSLIVPVYNEEAALRITLPPLMQALEGYAAQVVFVCNGTTDASAQIIRSIAGPAVRVLEVPQAGKTGAFNAAEKLVSAFPRFYLDADILVQQDVFAPLLNALNSGKADLVSPVIRYDLSQSTFAARAISRTWLGLPHRTRHDIQGALIGVSENGRKAWQDFPDIFADDSFMMAMVPAHRRKTVRTTAVTQKLPRSYGAWVAVRTRWLFGDRQLARLGIRIPKAPGQGRALIGRALNPRHTLSTTIYALARLHAKIRCSRREKTGVQWYRDETTRRPE